MVHRKLALGVPLNDMLTEWASPRKAKAIYGMTAGELAALSNLVRGTDGGIPEPQVDQLRLAAARWGVVRGPFTHAALGCKAMTVGYVAPECASATWKVMSANTPETINLIVTRVLRQWDETPPNLRKSANAETIMQMRKICSSFMVAKAAFQEMVPEDTFNAEWCRITEFFYAGTMDDGLGTASDEFPWPWDLAKVFPEIRTIIHRLDRDIEQKQLARHKELKEQVACATYTQLLAELQDDQRATCNYLEKLGVIKAHWSEQVVVYKRRRYDRGLETVRKVLSQRLMVHHGENLNHMMEYNVFKKKLSETWVSMKDTCLGLPKHVLNGYICHCVVC